MATVRMAKRANPRAGQTLILFTLAILPILGVIGLVVDIGWAYYRKEVAKTASDAAANAAAIAALTAGEGGSVSCSTAAVACYATDYVCPATPTGTDNISVGCMYAAANGFSTSATQSVSFRSGVGTPPGSTGISVGYWVIANVSEKIPQTFSAVLGFPTATITAQSRSGDQNAAAGSGGCIFSLAPVGSATLSMSGGSILQSGCGVQVNSNATNALTLSGSSSITTTRLAKTRIVGGWTSGGTSSVSPSPITGNAAMSDPWEPMPAPTVGACTDNGAGLHFNGATQTLNPGVICGGLSLGSSSVITLAPGVHIIKAGINLTGSSVITGAGVTIYLVSGGISASGSSKFTISAPTSGTWQGVAIFQARDNASTATLTGSTSQLINGLIYMPAATLAFAGGNSSNATTTTLAAYTISLTGNTYIKAPATTAYTPTPGGTVVIQ